MLRFVLNGLADFAMDIARDLLNLWAELQKPDTWILIGMMVLFGVTIFFGFYFALRFDMTLKLRHLVGAACRDIDNTQSAALFFALAAFALAMLTALGEFAQYLDNKARGYKERVRNARSALILATLSLVVGGCIILFFDRLCR